MQTIENTGETTKEIKYIAPQSYAPPPRRKRVKGGRPVLVQTRLTVEQAEKLDRFAKVYSENDLPLTHAAALALVLDVASATLDKVEERSVSVQRTHSDLEMND